MRLVIIACFLLLFFMSALSLSTSTPSKGETFESENIVFVSSCSGGVFTNLTLWIDGIQVRLYGYFCEAVVQAYIRYMVDYLMNQGYPLADSVKEIVRGYGYWKPTRINASLPNLDGWPLFLIKGGHCWAATRRAAYILSLYNITSLTVVLKTDPPHTILLVSPSFPGEKIIFNGKEYTVFINEPPVPLPRDITRLVKYAYN